ncbi:MAG: BamA/TamA family outer membrane protein [Myxococcales bacterium]|jgi:outer membrane protein assembly factor BamA
MRTTLQSLLALGTAALFALAAPGAAADEPADEPSQPERRFDALAIPLVSYNTDEGFGLGLAGGAYFYRRGTEPYAHAVAAQVFFTTGGIQSHFLRYDGPEFLGSSLRLEGRLSYRAEKFDPFYGLGNASSPGLAIELRTPAFSYRSRQAGGWIRVRLGGERPNPRPYAGYEFAYTLVRPYPGSVLEQEAPLGLDGGPTGRLLAGLLWDTRDNEGDPRSGGTTDLALRVANKATASRYDFGRLDVVLTRFAPLGARFVLAARLSFDWAFGDVPFFELPYVGGLYQTEGIGGMSSVRGLPRDRYVGELKVLGNAELRATLVDFFFFGATTSLRAVAFVDGGRVWSDSGAAANGAGLHGGAGVGLRLVRGAAALRFDYGVSAEFQAIYLTFGQVF